MATGGGNANFCRSGYGSSQGDNQYCNQGDPYGKGKGGHGSGKGKGGHHHAATGNKGKGGMNKLSCRRDDFVIPTTGEFSN